MTDELFRQEVVGAKQNQWLGSVMVAAPMPGWIVSSIALALAIAMSLFLAFGHYTRRESVTGQLVPSAGLINVFAPKAGTVTRVLVHEGQKVREGESLIEISNRQDSSALGDTYLLVDKQLNDQRARFQGDLENQKQIQLQQAAALRVKASFLRSQLAQIEGQLRIQRQQAHSTQKLLERIRPLVKKGYASSFQLQEQQSAALNAQTQYMSLVREQLGTRQEIEATDQQLAQLPLDAATHRNDTERELAKIGQATAQNEIQRALVLRAPMNGVVSAIMLKQGQMVTVGHTLLSILPSGSLLQAQLLVPSRAIGFVEPGSRVVMRYQAFPYQKFGQQYGKVIEISRSALSPSDIGMLAGKEATEPMYRVEVGLDSQYVLAYGEKEAVRPGMVLDADILMERRRLIEWVLGPIYGLVHRVGGDTING